MADTPLRLLLELDTKIRNLLGLDRNLGKVDAAAAAAKGSLGKLGDQAGDTERKLGGLSGAVGRFAERFSASFVAEAAVRGLARLGSAAIDTGKQMLKTIGDAEDLDRAFRALFSGAEADELGAWAEAIAPKTRFDDDAIKGFMLDLRRAGVEAAAIPDILRGSLDLQSLMGKGDPQAQLSQLGDVFANMVTRGTVNMRQLGAVGITKADFLGDLAKKLGVGVQAVEKQLSEGKIRVDLLQAAILESIAGKTGAALGGQGIKAGQGVNARLERLGRVPDEIFKAMGNSPALPQFMGMLDQLTKMLDPKGPLGGPILSTLGQVFSDLTGSLKGMDVKVVAGDLQRFLDIGITGFKLLFGFISGVVKLVTAVGEGIGWAAAKLYLFGEALLGLPGRIVGWGMQAGAALVQGFKDGILGNLTAIGDAVGEMAYGAVAKLKGLLGIASPSKVFEGFGTMTGEGFARGVAASQARIDGAVAQTMDVVPPSAGARRGGVGGGPVAISVPITVNWTGAGSEQDADRLAERIRDLIPGQLTAALEQMRVQMGAA